MKKLVLLFTFILALVGMSSCTPSNSPKGVTKQVLEALKTKDYNKVVDLMGDKGGNPLSAQAKANMQALIANKMSLSDSKTIRSYKITDEVLNNNGNNATVSFRATYANGNTQDENINLAKGADGQWRMVISPK